MDLDYADEAGAGVGHGAAPGRHRPHGGVGMVVMRSNTAMRPSTPGWKPVMDQQRGWSACLLPTGADPQAQTSSLTDACEVIVILRQTIQRFRWSEALLWAWEDLNLRPHPYQQSRAHRYATLRSCRSRPTVSGQVMRCEPTLSEPRPADVLDHACWPRVNSVCKTGCSSLRCCPQRPP
jgi:hypothetical protein